MAVRETVEQALERWNKLELLQQHYDTFDKFLRDVIEDLMGFTCSEVQEDIGNYIAYGPQLLMVQAQRSQAKTTIAAAYAVYGLIHDPRTRVLIISAGDAQATEIATWIIQIINNMDVLECLRPDRANGDRSSVEAYDVHYSLKGAEKSPSVACIGITANMQGKRADILIADDVESQKNSQTQIMRERLKLLTKDFASICAKGRILYLGTPQSIDSIYNDLPGRGYDIRIWPGRYPTKAQLPDYEGFLAPYIMSRLKADPTLQTGGGPTGDQGQPIDPVLLGEEILIKKEIDQGPSYFQLQHMLSTKLSDQNRFPLKLGQIRFLSFDATAKKVPMVLNFVKIDEHWIQTPAGYPIRDRMYRVREAEEYAPIEGNRWVMYIDPAGGGQNGDETAYAVTGFCAGRVYVADIGGVPGGLSDEATDELVKKIVHWNPRLVQIEQNFGNGALAAVIRPKLELARKEAGLPPIGIEEVWETGQKELRIIDTIEPILSAGKLVMHEDLILKDHESVQKYPADVRPTYSLLWQIARITRDKGSLIHEDRLDALAGAIRPWVELVAKDVAKEVAKAKQAAYNQMMKNPTGTGRPVTGMPGLNRFGQTPNLLQRHGLSGIRIRSQ